MGNQAAVFSREDDDGMLFSSIEGRESKTFDRVCFLNVLGFKKRQTGTNFDSKTKMDQKTTKVLFFFFFFFEMVLCKMLNNFVFFIFS